jgi:hypothetical protein
VFSKSAETIKRKFFFNSILKSVRLQKTANRKFAFGGLLRQKQTFREIFLAFENFYWKCFSCMPLTKTQTLQV